MMLKNTGEESIRTVKARLRREGTRKRDALTLEERTLKSQVICRALMEDPAWNKAEAVLTYMNFRTEVITDSLVDAALLQGKKVYAPRILDSGISGAMEFFKVTDPDLLKDSSDLKHTQPSMRCTRSSAAKLLCARSAMSRPEISGSGSLCAVPFI